MTDSPLDSIECCTFCTEVLRPTHLFLLYSRCVVLYDYHPSLIFVIPGLLVFHSVLSLLRRSTVYIWFVRPSVHLSVLYSNR